MIIFNLNMEFVPHIVPIPQDRLDAVVDFYRQSVTKNGIYDSTSEGHNYFTPEALVSFAQVVAFTIPEFGALISGLIGLFAPRKTFDWSKLCKALDAIVLAENQKLSAYEAMSQVRAALDLLKIKYQSAIDSDDTKEKLAEILAEVQTYLIIPVDNFHTPLDPKLQFSFLNAYIFVCNLRIAVYQAQALHDNKPPMASEFHTAASTFAKESIENLESTIVNFLNNQLNSWQSHIELDTIWTVTDLANDVLFYLRPPIEFSHPGFRYSFLNRYDAKEPVLIFPGLGPGPAIEANGLLTYGNDGVRAVRCLKKAGLELGLNWISDVLKAWQRVVDNPIPSQQQIDDLVNGKPTVTS
jgi:hypothetical protein